MTPAEKAEVKVMLQNADASLSDTEAEIALLFLEQLTPRLDVPTVKAAVEAAQANLKPSDAKVPCSLQKLQLDIRAIFGQNAILLNDVFYAQTKSKAEAHIFLTIYSRAHTKQNKIS